MSCTNSIIRVCSHNSDAEHFDAVTCKVPNDTESTSAPAVVDRHHVHFTSLKYKLCIAACQLFMACGRAVE
eukprot:20749-Heterococcus_DN1.PRE.2